MQKKIAFKNPKNMKIVGVLHCREGQARPGVILSHGFLSTRNNGFLKKLATDLYAAGFSVLRFDYTGGIGESEGSMADVTIEQHIDDLESAIEFMTRSKCVMSNRIGLVGHSLGGAISMEVASRDKRVNALALVSSPANFHYQHVFNRKTIDALTETLPERLHKSRSKVGDVLKFYEDAKKYDLMDIASNIGIPTLFVHGDRDRIVSVKSSRDMFAKVKGVKELRVVDGAHHGFLLKAKSEEASKFVVHWMKSALKDIQAN